MRRLLWLTLLFGLWYFPPLGQRALWDPDEGRYAEIAREMVERGDWVTPHLNYLKYFEKPPLMYWCTALAFKLLGENELAARVWCALFGLGGVLLTYGLGRLLGGTALGWRSALIVGSAWGYIGFSHYLTLDMALTFWVTLAFFFFVWGWTRPRYQVLAFLGMFAAVGGAILTKGMIGFFPLVVVLLMLLWQKDWLTLKRVPWGAGLVVTVLVAAPWFFLVSLRNPEFPRFFFVHEHVQRLLTTVHGRTGPFTSVFSVFYYVPVVLVGLLPWSCFFPIGGLRHPKASRSRMFAVVWAAALIGFFSFSRSKLPGYVLPAFPALALLCGEAWTEWAASGQPLSRLPRSLVVVIFLSLAVAAAVLAITGRPFGEVPVARSGLLLFAAFSFVTGVILLLLVLRAQTTQIFFALVGAALVTVVVVFPALRSADAHKSNKLLVHQLRPHLRPETRLVSYRINYERRLQSLAFYTKRQVLMIGGPWEFALGDKMAVTPSLFPEAPGVLERLFARHPDLIGVTKVHAWQEFVHQSPLPLIELARSSDKVAFTTGAGVQSSQRTAPFTKDDRNGE